MAKTILLKLQHLEPSFRFSLPPYHTHSNSLNNLLFSTFSFPNFHTPSSSLYIFNSTNKKSKNILYIYTPYRFSLSTKVTSMTGEDWVEAAMGDDSMVVELLLGLSQTPANNKPALPPGWRVRQRRSKPVSVISAAKKLAPRASPNTPLSWSGATSGSGGAVDGGLEESSRPPSKPAPNARSKLNETSEKTATKKSSRKKKTLADLKQEEAMLLKERRQLKKELSKLRVNLESQKATNENLKRRKLDLQTQMQSENIVTVASNQLKQKQETGKGEEERVVLPDLNLPLEEDQILN